MRLYEVHPKEDELERYLLGHTTGLRTDAIEDHLLICGSCQVAAEDTDAWVGAMRIACRGMSHDLAAPQHRWWQIRIPMAAYAASFAVLITVLSVGYVYRGSPPASESELVLTATRSAGEQQATFAAAGSTALLHLDATSLPSRGRYVVELIDLAGGRVWAGEAAVQGGAVTIRIGKRLNAGRYWVRLNDASGVELREFELNVR